MQGKTDGAHRPRPTGLSEAFIGAPLTEGFDNDGAALEVGPERWQDLQGAAEVLAARVRRDPALYARPTIWAPG